MKCERCGVEADDLHDYAKHGEGSVGSGVLDGERALQDATAKLLAQVDRRARCSTCDQPALEGADTCGAIACRERNESTDLPPSGAVDEERDGATPPSPSPAPSRSGCAGAA